MEVGFKVVVKDSMYLSGGLLTLVLRLTEAVGMRSTVREGTCGCTEAGHLLYTKSGLEEA